MPLLERSSGVISQCSSENTLSNAFANGVQFSSKTILIVQAQSIPDPQENMKFLLVYDLVDFCVSRSFSMQLGSRNGSFKKEISIIEGPRYMHLFDIYF